MFAVVARGVRIGLRAAGVRIGAPRVTHALLFLAASIVSPGVRGACGAACCRDAALGHGIATCCTGAGLPTPEPAGADACCGTARCTAAASGAAATDPPLPAEARSEGDCGCRCESAPPGVPATPPPRDQGPVAATAPQPAGVPCTAAVGRLVIAAVPPTALFVERPVRIRFGVWLD